ncbi:hypothetical protein [Streptomyces sp. A012304]|uniref:hypothetical protein n=1 Tax=Streptomyces sp. A012304 TaxID=375446 RepID=UPI00222F7B0A|nr:hypothetical protein [Streptomyces sp. A012304]GKQ39435.1 hypothetical protein ALMP_59620 [Streptomyces sp. A012304]
MQATASPANRTQGHGLTIRVYTVNRHGTVTADTGTRFVPADGPATVSAYPPCGCPLHREVVTR